MAIISMAWFSNCNQHLRTHDIRMNDGVRLNNTHHPDQFLVGEYSIYTPGFWEQWTKRNTESQTKDERSKLQHKETKHS